MIMESNQISAFIDDELVLTEKIDFIQAVHADRAFMSETVDLLRQELRLRDTAPMPAPPSITVPIARFRRDRWRWLRPVGVFGGGLVTALLMVALMWGTITTPSEYQHVHRFVVYQPDARQAAITGDFTNWKTVNMHSAGRQGYWEVYVPLSPGEHHYSFLLDGHRQVADPTQPVKEQDDFGGQNSILVVPDHVHI
jgi:hypothetical protein